MMCRAIIVTDARETRHSETRTPAGHALA
jgi:hypothetical protein